MVTNVSNVGDMPETLTAKAETLTVRVRAYRFIHGPAGVESPDRKGDYDKHVRTFYEVARPAIALTAFAAAFPEVVNAPNKAGWHLTAYRVTPCPGCES